MGSFNSKLEEADFENAKDGLQAMQGWIEAKLDRFYVEMQDELVGGGNRAIRIPIVSIVRKSRATFIKDISVDKNVISSCIRDTVGNVISGEWEAVVTDILKGALNVFLGDSQVATGGQMQEHKSMHVVWANNALLRLDAFVVRFDVSTKSDFRKHAQYFAGHMLLSSVVDFDKISSEIVAYELTRFIRQAGKVLHNDGTPKFKDPKAKVLKEIMDVKSILMGVTEILSCVDKYQIETKDEELSQTADSKDKGVENVLWTVAYALSDDKEDARQQEVTDQETVGKFESVSQEKECL